MVSGEDSTTLPDQKNQFRSNMLWGFFILKMEMFTFIQLTELELHTDYLINIMNKFP